jgi:hypothetical protein
MAKKSKALHKKRKKYNRLERKLFEKKIKKKEAVLPYGYKST